MHFGGEESDIKVVSGVDGEGATQRAMQKLRRRDRQE